MSLLVVGLSHRTAPLPVLERVAAGADAADALARSLLSGDHVAEAAVVSTCNRLEVYADVTRFHGGVADVGARLAESSGLPVEALTEHLYAHYEDRAVAHLFAVACGLDSMAVGEAQILGQVREALRRAEGSGTAGRALVPLLQQALRVGKRAHAETGIDAAGPSLVDAGLARAARVLRRSDLRGARALVVGAGAMSGLAAATLQRAGAHVVVANRSAERGERLAESVGGRAVPLEALAGELAAVDLVLTCTGAVGHVVTREQVAGAVHERGAAAAPLVLVDLALPRDVEPLGELGEPGGGAVVVDLDQLGRDLSGAGLDGAVQAVRAIVAAEVEAHLAAQRAESVAPTVVALRAHARDVVDAELGRLDQRLAVVLDRDGAALDPAAQERLRSEVAQTVHRVVEKLLHTPTVRVKQLAEEPGGGTYADALRQLFDLEVPEVTAVGDLPRAVRGVVAVEGRAS